jgi:thiosulfate dehydrogenase
MKACNRNRVIPFSLGLAVALLTWGVPGPAGADKTPVTPQQLKAYDDAFMAEVKKGDLLFHGDAATAKQMNVNLSATGMACAMCHPMRDMINWCIEKPQQGERIDPESTAMKDLEAYIYWSNSGSVLDTGKY